MTYPWSAGNQLDAADLDDIALSNLVQLVAMESITAGKAVAAGLYQATPITIDTKGIGALGSGANNISITIAANSNILLLVFASTDTNNGSAATVTGTWNGGGMTSTTQYQIAAGYNRVGTIMYLKAPTTGAHTLTLTASNTGHYSYYVLNGVNQTTPVEGQTGADTQSGTGASVSYTHTVDGSVAFGYSAANDGDTVSFSGTVFTADTQTSGKAKSGDDGLTSTVGAGTVSTCAWSGNSVASTLIAAVVPANAPVAGVQLASSASSSVSRFQFIGFSKGAASAGGAVLVRTGGVTTEVSGIASYTPYYLNDTNGTIGTSAGSVSRKVGIGINATQLLITNIW